MKNIKIQIKNVYGTETIYPVCDNAKAFAAIAGTKTLTESTIREVKKLGYDISLCMPSGLPFADSHLLSR